MTGSDPVDRVQINTNTSALNAMRSLAGSAGDLARTLQRLSSGVRINSAADDAAGLAISTRMTTQVRGFAQAARNANDGISMLQTAEGALSTVTANLQRVRELAVQAANATNATTDRAALGAEARQLLAEVDRIGRATTFNGSRVFAQDGQSIGGDPNQRAVLDSLRMSWLAEAEQRIKDQFGLLADGASMQIDITKDTDGSGGYAAFVASTLSGAPGGRGTDLRMSVDMANFTPPNLPDGGTAPFYNDRIIAHEMVHAVMARSTNWASLNTTSTWFLEGAAEFIHGADERLAADIQLAAGTGDAKIEAVVTRDLATWGGTSADYSAGYVAVRYLHDKLKTAGYAGGIKDFMVYLNGASAPTMNQALAHFFGGAYTQTTFLTELAADSGNGLSNATMFVKNRMNLTNADTGAIGGLDSDGGAVLDAQSVLSNRASGYADTSLQGFRLTYEKIASGVTASQTLKMQVGAEVGQTVDVRVGSVNTKALGLDEIDLVTAASRALIHVDQALEYVNSQRATIGAQLSRLDSAIATLQTSIESTSASRSRILDADYASETATLVRSQILQRAGVAILAQANASPQIVLQLLR